MTHETSNPCLRSSRASFGVSVAATLPHTARTIVLFFIFVCLYSRGVFLVIVSGRIYTVQESDNGWVIFFYLTGCVV